MPFGRKLNVSLMFGTYVKVLSEKYKIDFDITQSTGGTYSSGSLTITGLPTADILRMATFYNYENLILMPNAVAITAGYGFNMQDFTPRYSIIFTGAAVSAEVSLDTPDKSITFELSSMYYQNEALKVAYTSAVPTPLPAVITAVVGQVGFVANVSPELSAEIVKSFKYEGQLAGFIEKVRAMYPDLEFYTDNNIFHVSRKGQPSIQGTVLPTIIKSSELVGSPEPTFIGCNIRTILKPTVKSKDLIQIITDRYENVTIGTTSQFLITGRQYVANNVRHYGSTRDAPYYTEIECSRFLPS